MVEFFSNLFKGDDLINIDECCNSLNCKIHANIIADLIRPYNREDVLHALLSMSPTKTPGLDGFNALFFQKFWDVVGDNLSSMVLGILNDCQNPVDINHTYFTLIPKVPRATCPSQYRPISLCNVAMKIVTKCIANRLKLVLPDILMKLKALLFLVAWLLVMPLSLLKLFTISSIKGREERGIWILSWTWRRIMIEWNDVSFSAYWKVWSSRLISLTWLWNA